jgi:hypothetical protein
MEIPAGELNPEIKRAGFSFNYNVVGVFRATRGGRVLGIIACGADACVRSIWCIMRENHGTRLKSL